MNDDKKDSSEYQSSVEDLYEKALIIYMNSRDLLIELSELLEPKN